MMYLISNSCGLIKPGFCNTRRTFASRWRKYITDNPCTVLIDTCDEATIDDENMIHQVLTPWKFKRTDSNYTDDPEDIDVNEWFFDVPEVREKWVNMKTAIRNRELERLHKLQEEANKEETTKVVVEIPNYEPPTVTAL